MRFKLFKPNTEQRPGGWRGLIVREFGRQFSAYRGNGPVGISVQHPTKAAAELHLFPDEADAEVGIAYILAKNPGLVRVAKDCICPTEDVANLHFDETIPPEKREWLLYRLFPWQGLSVDR